MEFPQALTSRRRWVRWAQRDKAKVPLTNTGRPAGATWERTWSSFPAAARAITTGDGLGFVLNGDGIIAIDFDDCLNDDGSIQPWAARWIAECPRTYAEVSHSGQGLHLWGTVREDSPYRQIGSRIRSGATKIEIYGTGRFIAMGEPVTNAGAELADLTDLVHSIHLHYGRGF